MSSAAPNGSIASLPSPRADLLAFEIRKKIPEADIEWMSAIVDRAFDAHDEIDMLLIMTNYDGSELGAIFDGEAMKVQTRSLAHVRRYVVVGAPAWANAMINVFGTVLPVEPKTFGLDQVEDAWRWVSAPPNPGGNAMAKPSSKETIRNDAKGAMAPSQGDSHNDGAHSAKPEGDRDATRKHDDHAAPTRPVTGKSPGKR